MHWDSMQLETLYGIAAFRCVYILSVVSIRAALSAERNANQPFHQTLFENNSFRVICSSSMVWMVRNSEQKVSFEITNAND